MPRALVALGLMVATAVTTAVALAAGPKDHAAQAWNVLPPGQAGGVAFTKNSTDQIALYEGLTLRRDRVTDADLRRYFKRETLGLGSEKAVRTERPRAGVTVTRDRWGVPHVKGRTAEDVAFGAGWATAADRQLIMELLRGPGRIAALDAPGDQRILVRPLGPELPAERCDGGAPRAAVRPAPRARAHRGSRRSA